MGNFSSEKCWQNIYLPLLNFSLYLVIWCLKKIYIHVLYINMYAVCMCVHIHISQGIALWTRSPGADEVLDLYNVRSQHLSTLRKPSVSLVIHVLQLPHLLTFLICRPLGHSSLFSETLVPDLVFLFILAPALVTFVIHPQFWPCVLLIFSSLVIASYLLQHLVSWPTFCSLSPRTDSLLKLPIPVDH